MSSSDSSDSNMVEFTLTSHEAVPLSAAQQAELSALEQRGDEGIDFSDIPELSEEELAEFRPVSDRSNKEPISIRLDADVVAWLRQTGRGWQTRLNALLREAMLRENPGGSAS